MALEDIRDSLQEQLKAIAARVRETDGWLKLNEKYQGLSPVGQKVSIAGAALVAFLILMAVPWTFYSSSRSSVDDFESKRGLIRELFHVNREASSLPLAPAPVATTELQNNARNSLTTARLQPDQIISVTDSPSTLANVPKTIDQAGIQVVLAKLNLKQVVDIGHELQNLQGPSGTARMTGLEIKANVADSRYYDVVYRVVAFSAKLDAAPSGKNAKTKGRSN